jgi:hypothetical protein
MPTKPFVSMQNVAKRWNGQLGMEEVSLDIEEGSFVEASASIEHLDRACLMNNP